MTKKKFSDRTWKMVRAYLASGLSAVATAAKFPEMKASDIYRQKKKWEKEAYYTNPRFARFHTDEYKAWRAAVLRRDNFKCVVCKKGKPQVILQADHIKAWSTNQALRYDVSNGRTLCVSCHKKTPNYGKKALTFQNDIDPKQWEKDLRKKLQDESKRKALLKKLKEINGRKRKRT